ncbi:MAG TPA: hypothetical protein PLT46_03865 [Burkholderiaceae bacterium]|jgi:hypothetical protein|nr:hypothetical protein [Burkholderiaceae bacterium]
MEFSRRSLNRPDHQSTEAEALAQRALAIYLVEVPTAAQGICARFDRVVTVGALDRGDPVPGFHFGN